MEEETIPTEVGKQKDCVHRQGVVNTRQSGLFVVLLQVSCLVLEEVFPLAQPNQVHLRNVGMDWPAS